MMNNPNKQIVVYGFGSVGRHLADSLLALGYSIPLILDRGQSGQRYGDIPILSLDHLNQAPANVLGMDCLIGMHNHYIDLSAITADLIAAGFRKVVSLTTLVRSGVPINAPNGYWLERGAASLEQQGRIERFLALLADDRSVALAREILAHRATGDVTICPPPSLIDEYVPDDLPRYRGRLRVIDCGAFTGVSLHKLRSEGYEIEAFAAFEPDPDNFAVLASRDYGADQGICLPLATWSSLAQLRFASNNAMDSALADDGDIVVQCVAIDAVLKGFAPNLIKLDVEGAEGETLAGLEHTIRTYRPNLCISAYHTADHLYDLALLIDSWQLGYRFHLRVHSHNSFGVVVYARQTEHES